MNGTTGTIVVAMLASAGAAAKAQAPSATAAPLPATVSAIPAWDVALVRRAQELLASPNQWSRVGTHECPGEGHNVQPFFARCSMPSTR